MKTLLPLCVVLLLIAGTSVGAVPSFYNIGYFAGGNYNSVAYGITPDGQTIVGAADSGPTTEAFVMSLSNKVLRGLGQMVVGSQYSAAYAVSSGADAIVGEGDYMDIPGMGNTGFYWTKAKPGPIDQTPFPGGFMTSTGDINVAQGVPVNSINKAVTVDGLVVAGQGTGPHVNPLTNVPDRVAYIWKPGSGFTSLGDLNTTNTWDSSANGVAGNGAGLVVAGYASQPIAPASTTLEKVAFRWTPGTGMVPLGYLPNGTVHFSVANAVSQDTNVIVGASTSGVAGGTGTEAFMWTSGGGMVGLGVLGGGSGESWANCVDADGSVIAGWATTAMGQEAMIWDAGHGMRRLADVLLAAGINLDAQGWQLLSVNGISADGMTLVGAGTNPDGMPEGWVVTIPEPMTMVLLGLGGLLALRRRRSVSV